MAKWIKIAEDRWVNASNIASLHIAPNGWAMISWTVMANGNIPLTECKTQKEAEKFIKDFIDEHYINTGKVE